MVLNKKRYEGYRSEAGEGEHSFDSVLAGSRLVRMATRLFHALLLGHLGYWSPFQFFIEASLIRYFQTSQEIIEVGEEFLM